MSVAADVRLFLRSPTEFAAALPVGESERWLRGLAFAGADTAPLGRVLRPTQREAWRGIAGHRVSLVLGPPGTGKTFLLAAMAAGQLVMSRQEKRACRVLLAGFTRESIGNLFDALEPMLSRHAPDVSLAFLGNPPDNELPDRVRLLNLRGEQGIVEGLIWLETPLLVAGANAWSLSKLFKGGMGPEGGGPTARVFDLVLIDEASQMLVAQGLMSLSGLAEGARVIVAGDDRQLPPVRQGHALSSADGRTLGGSLYEFLKSANAAEFRLEETFRLNGPLAEPVARQFYDGKYFSADEVKGRRLSLAPNWEEGLEEWQRLMLDPELPLCVVLYDGPPCATDNPFERHVLSLLVGLLAERIAGDQEKQWRDQLALVLDQANAPRSGERRN